MKSVGLWGLPAGAQAGLLARLPAPERAGLRLLDLSAAQQLLAVEEFALLALSPRASVEGLGALPQTRILLLPGGLPGLLRGARAKSVISYGGAQKESISLSSRGRDSLTLALLRELPTVHGGLLERQELILPCPEGKASGEILFRAGLLLLLGLPPQQLAAALLQDAQEEAG